jgi:hypothetical protein
MVFDEMNVAPAPVEPPISHDALLDLIVQALMIADRGGLGMVGIHLNQAKEWLLTGEAQFSRDGPGPESPLSEN